MLGKKAYQEKLFTNFSLESRIPEHNFYRCLKKELNLSFLYNKCKPYYGDCGQKSIDPVVFFKLMLVGYLEGISSDRQLIDCVSLRLDILYFINYDVDEELPWHSTISRTRKKLPTEVFEKTFEKVFEMCANKGMVSGHTQSVDSALIKANASLDNIEKKQPQQSVSDYLTKVESQDENDDQDKTKAHIPNDRKTSNNDYYSPSDPDARIARKPGKPTKLYYQSQMAVDSAHCVISHIEAQTADTRDSEHLIAIAEKLKARLNHFGFLFNNILADTNYSSGENYHILDQIGLQAYIPVIGSYKGGPKGFVYDGEKDQWKCPKGEKARLRSELVQGGSKKKEYVINKKQCKGCEYYQQCIGEKAEKRFKVSSYKPCIDKAIERVKTKQGKYFKRKRQSTVEPVFGSLMNNMGMNKLSPGGITAANKVFIMTAIAYNLKKYMKFIAKQTNINKQAYSQIATMAYEAFKDRLLSIRIYNKSIVRSIIKSVEMIMLHKIGVVQHPLQRRSTA